MPAVCTNCKKTDLKVEEPVAASCKQEYRIVEECMEKYNGSISACNREWKAFRLCFNKDELNKSIKK